MPRIEWGNNQCTAPGFEPKRGAKDSSKVKHAKHKGSAWMQTRVAQKQQLHRWRIQQNVKMTRVLATKTIEIQI